jgi:diguanylate cyclase (GGDEF)-like protein
MVVSPVIVGSAETKMEKLKTLIIRHRFTLTDLVMIAAVVAAATFGAWQYDVFPNETEGTREHMLELDEIFAVSALGFALFSWSRLNAQRREIRRRRAAEDEARALAFEDTLTGLPNRRQFEVALKAALASPPGAGSCHAVLMLDLNGFKRINDVYGHPIGDMALLQTATRLRRAIRDGDMVARLGGDEFAVLARHLSGADAAAGLAMRIIDELSLPVQTVAGDHHIGTGIGIALFPMDGSESDALVRKADVALYRAKSELESALRFFEEDMDRLIRERDRLERDLKAAIGTAALQVRYQPRFNLRSGAVSGFDALGIWTHDQFGEQTPNRLEAIAESARLTREVTEHILRRACEDASDWKADITLSVQIASPLLRDSSFPLRLLTILNQTGLSPSRLELDIPESTLVADLDSAQRVLGAIHVSGVRIALSHFGTGYSSLYHLRNFHLDTIKIDRSLIQGMSSNPQSAAIVRALIGLGTGLGLTVAAEGVEDAGQQAVLAEEGCQQADGHVFGAHLSGEEALKLLRRPPANRAA